MGVPALRTVPLRFWRGHLSLYSGIVLDPLRLCEIHLVFLIPFWIFRRTRQGYPLSPALFILALEPLAMTLCADQNISEIPYADHKYKLNLFTDDALLTLTNPLTTLLNLQWILSQFSLISGLRVNLDKTVALNVTLAPDLVTHPQTHFPFQWTSSHIDYLGIQLTPSCSSLFLSNYYPLFHSLLALMQS